MIIEYRREVYVLSHNNQSFSRIDGVWHINTGGNPLNWTPLTEFRGVTLMPQELERLFVEIDVKTIEEILLYKKIGVDCSEEESGHIKMVLKEIMERFPCEFSEAIEEQENTETRMVID